jgi:hypothetical protein
MATGRSQPSIVIDVQVLVTHTASVATMEQEMGHPPRIIRAPDVCYLFHARDQERLPGLVDRWASYGIAAQVVLIPPAEEPSSRPGPAGHDTSTPATGPIRQSGPRIAPPTPGETI